MSLRSCGLPTADSTQRTFPMPKVDSSMMTGVEYDKTARELVIVFSSGKTYVYGDVPPQVYRSLLKAASKGSYFLDATKDAYLCAPLRGRRRGPSLAVGRNRFIAPPEVER